MNLDQLLGSLTFQVEAAHKGKPTGVKITLSTLEQASARVAMAKMARAAASLAESDEDSLDAPAILEMLVARTQGWEGLTYGGEPVPFSQEAARNLYSRDGMYWLRKQVFTAVMDEARFFGQ